MFSFERQIIPEHPAHEADFVWTRAYHNIRRVRAVGPLRVQFEIDRPYAPFLANLAMGPAAIVSPTAVRKWGREFGRHPVGAGPYRFVEWIPGDRITLERNPDYWDQPRAHPLPRAARDARLAPAAAGARVGRRRRHPAARARRSAARAPAPRSAAGDGAGGAGLVPGDEHAAPAARRSAHPPRDRPRDPPRGAGQARLPGARHPGDRPAAAQRLGRALRRRHLSLRSGRARASCSPRRAGRGSARRRSSCSRPRRRASTCRRPARVAGIIKKCLAEVGIAVDVILSDPADHQRALWAGEHDLALHGWFNDNGDPDNFLYTLLDSDNTTGTRPSNIAFYSNGWFHDVIGMAQRTRPTRTERERLYSQAQAILAIDVPWVPLAHSKVVFAERTRARPGGAAVGDGPLPLGGARAMSPDGRAAAKAGGGTDGKTAPKARAARSSGRRA